MWDFFFNIKDTVLLHSLFFRALHFLQSSLGQMLVFVMILAWLIHTLRKLQTTRENPHITADWIDLKCTALCSCWSLCRAWQLGDLYTCFSGPFYTSVISDLLYVLHFQLCQLPWGYGSNMSGCLYSLPMIVSTSSRAPVPLTPFSSYDGQTAHGYDSDLADHCALRIVPTYMYRATSLTFPLLCAIHLFLKLTPLLSSWFLWHFLWPGYSKILWNNCWLQFLCFPFSLKSILAKLLPTFFQPQVKSFLYFKEIKTNLEWN